MILLVTAIISSIVGNVLMWVINPYIAIPYAIWTIVICVVVSLMIA